MEYIGNDNNMIKWAESRDVYLLIRVIGGAYQIEIGHKSGAGVTVRSSSLYDGVKQAQTMWDENLVVVGK